MSFWKLLFLYSSVLCVSKWPLSLIIMNERRSENEVGELKSNFKSWTMGTIIVYLLVHKGIDEGGWVILSPWQHLEMYWHFVVVVVTIIGCEEMLCISRGVREVC